MNRKNMAIMMTKGSYFAQEKEDAIQKNFANITMTLQQSKNENENTICNLS